MGVRVIGDASYRLEGAAVEALAWDPTDEVSDLSQIDVGGMPLPDDDWSRGKCGLKALRYVALGIPTVLSPVGVNREIAEGGAAVLASSDDEWREALRALIDDDALRTRVGQAGRVRVGERLFRERDGPTVGECASEGCGTQRELRLGAGDDARVGDSSALGSSVHMWPTSVYA